MGDRRPALDVSIPQPSTEQAELVAALIDDFRPFAVEERPQDGGHDLETGAKRQRVHFFSSEERDAAAHAIAERLGPLGVVATVVDVVDDGAAWAIRSQAGLTAIQIGEIVIAPPWDVPSSDGGHITVIIRPSMGFGTGHHESTRLCIRALQRHVALGQAVTDLGAGSGVLSIVAARLGAHSVVAVETDPDALDAARRNIAENDVTAAITLQRQDLRNLPSIRPADLVLANLTSALLSTASKAIARCARAGGLLVLSGFTVDEEASVAAAYRSLAVPMSRIQENDWVGLVMRTSAVGG